MLGSDNASFLAYHDNIPYVQQLNQQKEIKVRNWVYNEACTGKGRLDNHFSFVNVTLKSYCIDGHDIVTESDIFEVLQYEGGLAGSRAMLFDGTHMRGPVHI